MLSQQYQDNINTILQKIEEADAIIVGGASGMSTANGHDFYGHSRYWIDNFSEFEKNYGIRGNFEALYYNYRTRICSFLSYFLKKRFVYLKAMPDVWR